MSDLLRFEASIDLSHLPTREERKAALDDWLGDIRGMIRCDGYAGLRYGGQHSIVGRWSVDGRRCEGDDPGRSIESAPIDYPEGDR